MADIGRELEEIDVVPLEAPVESPVETPERELQPA